MLNEFENGESINREENEVIFSRLRDHLKINPGIPINSINEAIEEFTRDRTSMILKANEEIYRYLKHGMKVKIYSKRRNYEKFFIDWDNVENNNLMVSQLWITGDYQMRRPDY